MGYLIPAGYARCSFEYNAASSLGSSIVFGFGVDANPGEILLDQLETWWNESLKLRTSNSYTLSRIECRNDIEVAERSIGAPGLLTSPASPPNVAALMRLGSGLVGRKYRGRIYLPGVLLDGDVLNDGTIDPSTLTSIMGVMNYLNDVLDTVGIGIVILHSDVGTPTPVTMGALQTVVATQRRRLRR